MALPPGINERRQDCIDHEERIDHVDKVVSAITGYLKAGGLIVGIFTVLGAPLIGWFASSMLTKLGSIENMLGSNNVILMQHTEQIKQVQGDVKDIQDRHRDLDRRGIIKQYR
jgi:hypothetical protein